MAKNSETSKLTSDQVKALGERLDGTSQNVYRLAKLMFGVSVGDEIFEDLERVCSLFKCEECNLWLPTDQKSSWRLSCCNECDSDDAE